MPTYDVLTLGRSGLDLYAEQVGASFEEVRSFAAYVGGSPANIAVGARRLGLRTAILTAVGDDLVGRFVRRRLEEEGIETRFIRCKAGRRTRAALLSMEPPDRFPIVHYRENVADLQIDMADVDDAPVADARALVIAGTNLCASPSREATLYAAEQARAAGVRVVLDLDFRADHWPEPRAFGVAVRGALRHVDVAIGTQDEIKAAVLDGDARVDVFHSQLSEARVAGDAADAVDRLLALGPEVLVEKRGRHGACVHRRDAEPDAVGGFPVTVQNSLGAGDAFAAGFLYGYLNEWAWSRAARFGNACGAIVVTRHGCSADMPTVEAVMAFAESHGGL